jgi:hypothetical protein
MWNLKKKKLFFRNFPNQERRSKQDSHMSQIYLLLSVTAKGLINK